MKKTKNNLVLIALTALILFVSIVPILFMEVNPPKSNAILPSEQEITAAKNDAPKAISISPNGLSFAYIRVALSPYHYQVGPEEWKQIHLYVNDPEDYNVIQWIFDEFEGTYSLSDVLFSPPTSGNVWESLIFYDENNQEIDRITWKNLYEKGIYLTPNAGDTFTFLYNNDIDWETFYSFFDEYKH